MERRKFIKITTLAGISLCLTHSFAWAGTDGQEEELDCLIIGSGYGGAVSALRLTQAGHRVTMLEMGLDWDKDNKKYKPFSNLISPKNNSTWLRKKTVAPMMNISHFNHKFTGVLDRMDFDNLKIYAGRGVGGGSLVNGGMAVQPKKTYFEEIFPALDADDFWHKYYPRSKAELEVNEISKAYYDSSKYYKFARVGEKEALKAGFKVVKVPNVYDFGYMKKEEAGLVPKSALAKEVIYGNNYGKKSLDKTYLHKARQTGLLTIYDLHQAVSIAQLKDGRFKVMAEETDTSGQVLRTKVFICKKVFLNAGSLGSTKLVLKSAHEGLLPKPDYAGEFWGNNGNIMTGRNMVNTVFNRIDKGRKEQEGIGTGVRQSTIPVAGIDNWEDKEHAFFAEISPLPMGMEVYTALYLVINKVKVTGSITFDPVKNDIKISGMEDTFKNSVENAKFFIGRMNKVNGGTKSGLLFNGGYGEDICYHPLGGLAIGKSTDNYGRVKGCKNLYVTDGALIPGSIGVNPFLTITAIAEHCMEEIIKKDF